MTQIKAKEYFDIIEMDRFLEKNYPDEYNDLLDGEHSLVGLLGEATSFNYNNDSLVYIEVGDHGESEESWLEDYGRAYVKFVKVLERLAADGHLPVRAEYNIHLWW